MSEFVIVGVISKIHGLSGKVKIIPTTNIWSIFTGSKKLKLYSEARNEFYEMDVEEIKRSGKYVVAKFLNISDPEAASQLVGLNVVVDPRKLPKLQNNEFYYFEVLGIKVFDEFENFLGKVEDILTTGSNEVLVIRNNEQEILFPMINEYIIEFQKEKKLKVRLPEWI